MFYRVDFAVGFSDRLDLSFPSVKTSLIGGHKSPVASFDHHTLFLLISATGLP